MITATKIGNSSSLGATLGAGGVNFSVYAPHATSVELLLFNSIEDACPRVIRTFWKPLEFELPPVGDGASDVSWSRWIETELDSPEDIVPWEAAPAIRGNSYRADARSVMMLFAVPQ